MSERMIWVVRLIGIIVFLVLMYLLMSLHSRLVKMNEESAKVDTLQMRDFGFRVSECETGARQSEGSAT